MTDHEVMQMALEVLEFYQHRCNQQGFYSVNKQPLPIKAITQLRKQLAKPQLESVEVMPESTDQLQILERLNRRSSLGYTEGWNAGIAWAKAQVQDAPVAWGQPDACGNILETISPHEKQSEMKKWAMQYPIPLYTTPPTVEAAIEATKEKAAQLCDHLLKAGGGTYGDLIRSMK